MQASGPAQPWLEHRIVVERRKRPVRTYRAFRAADPTRQRVRTHLRDTAIRVLATSRSVPVSNWIRFPYYHHVFDDERASFRAHLRWMKKVATPVSFDDAVALVDAGRRVDGRYFSVSFDDGYRNCLTNAMPILAEEEVPGAFFVATRYIGAASEPPDQALRGRITAYDKGLIEFLSWDDCRQLSSAGMTVGSHSVSHPRLALLSGAQVEEELRQSKALIEGELGIECRHFSCPKGQPGVDFLPERDPAIATAVGYRSFSTTARGTAHRLPDPMLLPRDHFIASWSVHQLRYFFSR